MRVTFTAADEVVHLVVREGFRSLAGSGRVDEPVLVRETGPEAPRSLEGQAAVLLDAPEEQLAQFECPPKAGQPRAFALPASIADRSRLLAYSAKGPAPEVGPAGLRRLRPGRPSARSARALAGLAVLAALAAGGAALIGAIGDGDERPAAPRAQNATREEGVRPRSELDHREIRSARRRGGRAAAEERARRIGERSRAIGSPSDGRLKNGVALPSRGKHFFTWNLPQRRSPNPRFRRYATHAVIARTLNVVRGYVRAHPRAARVGVGDLSLPRGGEFGVEFGGTGHVGHRNGTEVDLLYPRRDGRERATESPAQIDRRLAQDLLDRVFKAGAVAVVIDPRSGLRGPASKTESAPYHEEHMHVRFPAR